jgi:DNA polymerase-3 subunit delta
MRLDYKKLLQHIEENPSPVYLFSGQENFLKEELLRKLISKFNPGFNLDVLYGGESSGEDIVSRALTFPFGVSRRLVVVKSAEQLPDADRKKILSYIENPSPDTLFILMAEVKSGSDRFFSKVAEAGVEIDFRAMYENEVAPWLVSRARALGKRLTPKAAYELKERAGRDLRLLANELEKLSTEVGERGEIKLEDVQTLAGESKVNTAFELVDAIGRKKRNLGLRILSSLIQRGKTAPEIVGLLAWQLRRVWRAKSYIEKGMKLDEISKALKIPRFHTRGLIAQAGKFSHEKLREGFTALLETDVKTKSGEAPAIALELLIIRLCQE